MIPRFRPPIGLHELYAAFSPSRSDDIAAFEHAFAEVARQRHAVAFPYGRTGLIALLRGLGVQESRVICPAYTCVVVPNAIVASGNRPDFIDSAADANGNLEEASRIAGSGARALIATSIFGHPVDLDGLARFRMQHPDIAVIQDGAHGFLCEWNGRPVHHEGDAAIFGLNISKTMTSVFGGMVTTDNDALAERVRTERSGMLSAPGWSKTLARAVYLLAVCPAFYPPLFGLTEKLRQAGLLDRFTRYYSEDTIDMPSDHLVGMTGLEARVGRTQCGRLEEQIAARRRYARTYREGLADLPGLAFVPAPDGASYSHIAARVADRGDVMRAALTSGVQLGEVIEYSVPEMPAYKGYRRAGAEWPVARMLSRQTINLPLAGDFDQSVADRIIEVMRRILAAAPAPPPLPIR